MSDSDNQHDVRYDTVGMKGWPRYTCYTCGDTLLFKPYMDHSEWKEAKEIFFANHPHEKVKDEGARG